MDFTEQMLERICMDVLGDTKVRTGDREIDFTPPYRRVTITEAIREHTGVDITGMDENALRAACDRLGVEQDPAMGKGKLIDAIFGAKCEHACIQPTFITDYPVEMSPLTKRHRVHPELTERFELMVNGKELANAYSELNDPVEQRQRFEEQLRLSEKGDDEAMYIDEDFLRALEYGMPPTSGMGIGMDRLTMFLTGQESIQEVLLFPQMRPEKAVKKDAPEQYAAHGIAEAWAPVLQKAGYLTVESLAGANPQLVRQALFDINRKYNLELENPSAREVEGWIQSVTGRQAQSDE
jgi:lysyl-tRNA synthetase class 2